jgi:hypothetical protein
VFRSEQRKTGPPNRSFSISKRLISLSRSTRTYSHPGHYIESALALFHANPALVIRKVTEDLLVGVGMTITDHPLHRSGRALLTHPAPALGDDAKSPQGIRVMDSRRCRPSVDQSVHPLPRKPRPLAPASQRSKPMTCYLKTKRRQRLRVRRHTIVPVPLTYDSFISLQPAGLSRRSRREV